MAILRAAKRNKLKASTFGLPEERKYPINDRSHAINAEGRAKQQLKKGRISSSQYKEIVGKAKRKLGE